MEEIKKWLNDIGYNDFELIPLKEEASVRKYYRILLNKQSFVLMDSSLDLDSFQRFLKISELFSQNNINFPKIYDFDKKKGYLVLQDLGDIDLFDTLKLIDEKDFVEIYKKVIDQIVKIQKIDTANLDFYNQERFSFEMSLIKEWFLKNLLSYNLTKQEESQIQENFDFILKTVLEQPSDVFVHKDFHSRNIMVTKQKINLIDFQDALVGPITYDLVSLLKDVYVKLDRKQVEELVLYFKEKIENEVSNDTFLKWFDFMGLQRHLKILGIFSGLYLILEKDKFLKDIPLTFEYVLEVLKKYPELSSLKKIFERVDLSLLKNEVYKKDLSKYKGRIKELYYPGK